MNFSAFSRWLLLFTLAFTASLAVSRASWATEAPSLFTTGVVPIFQKRCFSCHNAREHKGDFSLETAAEVDASGYVVAGDPAGSHLLEVITPRDGKRPSMPKEGAPLTADEIATLRQWIAEGAAWPDGFRLEEPRVTDQNWWSWRPLHRPQLPIAPKADEAWARTPIDVFILAKLRERGLTPSPEADRRTLIRRLYFDLTGLPPSPADVEQFVGDADPQSYEHLVDRLLESPRYGERWARHWLDVVHYGDTHGYDKDKPRPNAWPYRDYVIRAFNADKPYSRFVEEQLAGDVLWPETSDGMVATGFMAAGPWDFIGHAEAPEEKYDGKVARNLDRDDMVTTTMNAFCSLTIQCARCHNHKLDAATMEDYYRTQAVFASIDRADRAFDADPQTARRRGALVQQKAELETGLESLRQEIETKKTPQIVELDKTIAELEGQLAAISNTRPDRSPAYGYHSAVANRPDDAKWVQVDLGRAVPLDHVLLFGADEYGWADFGFPERFKVEASNDVEFAQAVLLADQTQRDAPRPGAGPVHVEGKGVTARYLRVTASRLWSRRVKDSAPTNDWIFALGELAVISHNSLVAVQAVTAKDTIEALPRWGRQNLVDGIFGKHALTDFASQAGDATVLAEKLLALARPSELRAQIDSLLQQRTVRETEATGPELLARRDALQRAIETTKAELAALPAPQLVYAGMVHNGEGAFRGRFGLGPREIHVLLRGDVNRPDKLVHPGAVPLIPSVPAEFKLATGDEGQRRAALAHWVTHGDNPLTWRSIVNRVWLYHFGRGIVDTPNDFGHGGQLPTHPELLDWLAVEFRDGGQSLKTLHRMICTSAAYRQASHAESGMRNAEFGKRDQEWEINDPRSIDADNRLLWRMNRRRLTAEEIRDAALALAGKLDLTMGGPGFMDFVVEHPEHSPHYEYQLYDPNDTKTHRRAVYRFIVRSQPQPFMDTLDCADPSTSVPKREETLTSLQALAMLNNRFMIAMAQHFAARLTREQPALPDQLTQGFRLTTGRAPSAAELEGLRRYAEEYGLSAACRVLLNMNEFVFVD